MMESFDHDQLRAAVESKFGQKVVTFSDCQLLERSMANSGAFLSAHTLARYWGILKPNSRVYFSSILQLLKYLGFESLEAYKKSEGSSLKLVGQFQLSASGFFITASVFTDSCLIAGCNDGTLRIFDLDTFIEKSSTPLSEMSIISILIKRDKLFCLDQGAKVFVLNLF